MQNEANKFYSSGAARYFIRGIADQLSEEDPALMVEFFIALEIANAALVSWLIEEKETESSCLREDNAESREFRLAVGRLKRTLAKLRDSKICNRQVADMDFSLVQIGSVGATGRSPLHILPGKGIVPDGKA